VSHDHHEEIPMSFVCTATWTAKEGMADVVREALTHLSHASRAEPRNLYYQAYQGPQEPDVFRIFEVHTDEGAITAHGTDDHFQKWPLGQAIPALKSRVRDDFTTLDV
jgi:quinol monooxygenase YgiN